ncbi:aldose 1-epimerase [Ulvibacterium sp.]|uniref:aldose epimerase family protein n=1 Tax=Ulvibacterium sp. TaxID=2665914 RepID=UPI003CC6B116
MIHLQLENQRVKIDAGELVGYQVDGHEFIHQKGSPGWRSSDTEMFPIIGPTTEAEFKVATPKGDASQDQHGLLREMGYTLQSQSDTKAVFQKEYIAGATIKNSKYPKKSTEEELSWPYNFQFMKHFALTSNGLEITFTISGDKGMPFMLGYHPAFKLHTKNPMINTGVKVISLPEILAVGSRALQVPDCNEIMLKDKKELLIKTKGFGHFMLWTEVSNMVCVEPITFYPYAVDQRNLQQGFQQLNSDKKEFIVSIIPI